MLFDLSLDALRFGLDCQAVIALRLLKFASGAPDAGDEARLMVTEKALAAMDAQHNLARALLTGTFDLNSGKVMALYSRAVTANRKRLVAEAAA